MPNDPVFAQLNHFFVQNPTPAPLKTPRPTQPLPGYTHQLFPARSVSPYTNTTHPSPSTTLCSSSTLALRDDDTRNIFMSSDGRLTPVEVIEIHERLAGAESHLMFPDIKGFVSAFSPVRNKKLAEKAGDPFDDRPLNTMPPPAPLETARASQRQWMRNFNYAIRLENPVVRETRARQLALTYDWNNVELMHLIQAFVDIASKGEVEPAGVAALAVEMYNGFNIKPWSGHHTRFAALLQKIFLGHFLAYWDLKSKLDKKRVLTALNLSSSFGEFYRQGLFPRATLVGCVRVLQNSFSTIEHVSAIQNILFHAGLRLWKEARDPNAEISELRGSLWESSAKILGDKSLLLTANHSGETKKRVEAIITYLEDCHQALSS